MNITECRSCKAKIFWVKTEKGKAMPLDAMPFPDGNIVLCEATETAHVLAKKEVGSLQLGPRYKSHFATCPNSAKHRKPK